MNSQYQYIRSYYNMPWYIYTNKKKDYKNDSIKFYDYYIWNIVCYIFLFDIIKIFVLQYSNSVF